MRELLIEREKLYQESKSMRNLSFLYDDKIVIKRRKQQDKKYKQWKFLDKLIKAMEETK